ncbi:MAG: hypothetical protein R3C61_05420 [Bacteroidia bacterium]
MKYLSILFTLFFILCSCNDKSTRVLRSSKAASMLVGKKKQGDSTTWILSQTFDPYNGGQVYVADSLNPQFWVLRRDGTFHEFDSLNNRFGLWKLNRNRDRLSKNYLAPNPEISPQSLSPDFRYHLLNHTKDSLILAVQGRHGMLRFTYLRFLPEAELINLPTDSIPADSIPADSVRTDSLSPEKK